MKIKQPVARSALKNVIQRMAIQNTKVEIFQNSKKTKTIYIGGETQDQLGTFMMIEGAKEPYITNLGSKFGYALDILAARSATSGVIVFLKNSNSFKLASVLSAI